MQRTLRVQFRRPVRKAAVLPISEDLTSEAVEVVPTSEEAVALTSVAEAQNQKPIWAVEVRTSLDKRKLI